MPRSSASRATTERQRFDSGDTMISNIQARSRQWRAMLVPAVLVAIGCSQPPRDAAPPPPATPAVAAVALPQAVLPDGFTIRLELAETPEEVANGLMFRPSLPADRGMLFLFAQQRVPSFWMKNTLIPLDMLFIHPDGTVAAVRPDAVPGDLTGVSGGPDVLAVLEIKGGMAAALGIEAGDAVRHPAFGGPGAAWPCGDDASPAAGQ
jgi:uncharacterized membrane protein (UPF0127 family)